MKTIVAGTDFTASSLNACRYAALLAQKLNCKLTMFNMFDSPVVHSNIGLYGITYTSDRKASEKKIRLQRDELQALFPDLKISLFVSSGSFKKSLKEFTDKHLVEAAVMGLKAKDKISKYIYGTHGVGIVGKIEAPVIIVPEKYTDHQVKDFLIAVDNTEKLSGKVTTRLSRFVKSLNATLNALYIRTEDEVFTPIVKEITVGGKKIPVDVRSSKDIQTGIKNYASKKNKDLIIIFSKRHSVFYNFFAESHTKKVAFVANVPVMSIHE